MGTGKTIPFGNSSNNDIGRLKIIKRLFNIDNSKKIDSFKVGTGTNTPGTGDIDLQTPMATIYDILSGWPTLDASSQTSDIQGLLDDTQENGNALTEFAWCDSNGNILNRQVYNAISKSVTERISYVGTETVTDK
jgi:hypothetical protein